MNLKKRRYVRPELDRLMFEALHAIKGQTASFIARRSGLSPSTIRNMRAKHTRYPHASTLIAIAKAGCFTISIAPMSVAKEAPVARRRVTEVRVN